MLSSVLAEAFRVNGDRETLDPPLTGCGPGGTPGTKKAGASKSEKQQVEARRPNGVVPDKGQGGACAHTSVLLCALLQRR